VDAGITLHDSGDYKGAIEQYEKALTFDLKSPLANYEIAMTYLALKEYDKAIEHCGIVIAGNSDYALQAHILEGSALDLLGKPKEAIAAYKKAIQQFPEHHLLYYNLALTLFNQEEFKDAEEALQHALRIKPAHASSHMLLGYVMREQNHRVKSLLALYNFLLLEPKGNRAKSALEILNSELKKGVTRNSDKSTSIVLSKGDEKDEFSRAEFMLSLLEASKDLEKNAAKSEYELFSDNNKSFFSVLGESKKTNKGFWWNYYVDFFNALADNNHVEAFSYYISQAKDDEKITAWLKNNQGKIDAFSKWFLGYKREY
jgi:tetratricopeptide (TPR) repeat protein